MSEEDNKEPGVSGQGSGEKPESSSFWAELKRRKVMRVAITYAVVAWLIMQVAGLTFEGFGVPIWAFRFVVIVLWLFFPVALIITWAFELTPEGIKTTKSARESQSEETVSKSHLRKRNWFTFLFGAAVPTVVFGALAVYFFLRSGPSESELASTVEVEVEDLDKSIAVLPLANMSPDPENAFFADGVHEDVLTNLSKIKDLLVIGRTSTLQYRDTTKPLQQIGSELGVRYLLEGSVRRASNQVLVTVQLIDSQTGGHLWAENYNRNLDDIFAIQAAIAKEIANELKAVISPREIAEIERRPTENLEAYEFYVKHRQLDGGEEKIAMLEKAVALDPDFAEAWAALTTETIFWWDVGKNRSDPELRESAHQALAMAKQKGPGLPHFHLAQSTIALREDHDLEKAVEYLHEALEIDPNFNLAHMRLGQRYSQLGRWAEAQDHLETALRSDPFIEVASYLMHDVYRARGMWSTAREFITKKIELRDKAVTFWRWNLITNSYLETGNKPAFVAAIELDGILNNNLKVKMARALLLRDLEEVLRPMQSLESAKRFSFFDLSDRGFYLNFEPLQLLAALILFEQGDLENARVEAEKAKTYLESIINHNPEASPNYRAYLAICYALTGEKGLIPATVDQIRAKSRSTFWKYLEQAECEIHIAIAYLILGDHDKAIMTLEAASKLESEIFLNRELDLWFIFDRLRGNPRFDALLEG